MSRRAREVALRASLAILGVVVGVTLIELGVRSWQARQEAQGRAAWERIHQPPTRPPRGAVLLGEMIRPSAVPDVLYELIPGLSGITLKGAPVTINEHGFRGPAYAPGPSPAFRIVGLGDSVMFGWGVPEAETYLRRLEAALQPRSVRPEAVLPESVQPASARRPSRAGPRVEVINTAVPGYNTTMEVATLEARGLAFEPQLVLLGFVHNDLALPNFVPRKPAAASGSRSQLWNLLRRRLAPARAAPRRLGRAPSRADGLGFEGDPERVPARYRHMVGEAGLERALERLRTLRQQHGFALLVVAHRGAPARLPELCRELAIDYFDVSSAVTAAMAERGVETYLGSEFTVSATDSHPSALQHGILAEAIERHLRSGTLLDR